MTTLIPTTRPMSNDMIRQTSNTTFIGGNVTYFSMIASPAFENRNRVSMRDQHLPENDAPPEERAVWNKIVRDDAERRFGGDRST